MALNSGAYRRGLWSDPGFDPVVLLPHDLHNPIKATAYMRDHKPAGVLTTLRKDVEGTDLGRLSQSRQRPREEKWRKLGSSWDRPRTGKL